MKNKFAIAALALLAIAFNFQCLAFSFVGTEFTYQGKLTDGSGPANGTYDLLFTVYDFSDESGAVIAGPITNAATRVTNGLFTVTLDFGTNVFNLSERWLEIGARTNGVATFVTLAPRQRFDPTPYAIMARSAGSFVGPVSISQLPSVVVTNGQTNVSLTGNFSGSGGGLTNVDALSLGGVSANSFWRSTGNAGTTAGVNFIGTTDNQPLDILVNGNRAFRIEPASVPSLEGGYFQNNTHGSSSAAIVGGGTSGSINEVFGNYGFVGAGHGAKVGSFSAVVDGAYNDANSQFSFIGSGLSNTNRGDYSFIGGGTGNQIVSGVTNAFIGGGTANTNLASMAVIMGGYGNVVSSNYATIGGGGLNRATQPLAFIGGGQFNRANGFYAVIGGGSQNMASDEGTTIGGGERNVVSSSASTIGGGFNNTNSGGGSTVAGGLYNYNSGLAATIGGGSQNVVALEASTVAGGEDNKANAKYATVGGGVGNFATGPAATIAGGGWDGVPSFEPGNTASGMASVISGGVGNHSAGDHAVVAGGVSNTNNGLSAAIGGGEMNQIDADHGVIGGGGYNAIQSFASYSAVGGGSQNTVQSNASYSVIAGGIFNTNGSLGAVAGGGGNNNAGGEYSTVAGGYQNSAIGQFAVLSGGYQNNSGGARATVPGGYLNSATGDFSFAAGQQAQALHRGSFVWADSQNASFASTISNQFNVRADNGLRVSTGVNGNIVAQVLHGVGGDGYHAINFNGYYDQATSTEQRFNTARTRWRLVVDQRASDTMSIDTFNGATVVTALTILTNGNIGIGIANPTNKLHVAGGVSATIFVTTSDRNAKENFEPVSPTSVLEKVMALPITRWTFKEMPGQKHLGPMAQDFYAAFALGQDDKSIATVDEGGVALAAIKGLNEKVESENAALRAENSELKARLDKIEQILDSKEFVAR